MLLKKVQLADAVTARMRQLNIESQPAFAAWLSERGCRVNQATISRLLNLEIKEDTRRVKDICKYAEIDLEKFVVRTEPQKSKLLMRALEEAWNGTKSQERWLARIIRTAGAVPPAG